MSDETTTEMHPEWRLVLFREYPDKLDVSGPKLISLAGHPKDDVAKFVGWIAPKSEMQTEELPGAYVTSLTGDVADEVHEWPNLMLQFREGRLTLMRLEFQAGTALNRNGKPWWRFW